MRNRNKLALGALAGAGAVWGLQQWLRSQRRIELNDRVVIITGSTSGHGLIAARQAAEQGAWLVLAARDPGELEAAAAQLRAAGSRDVLTVPTDITDPAQAQRLVDRTLERHGRVDILVNNAGIISVGPLETMTPEDYHAMMDTNFWGAFHCIMAVLPSMLARRFGRIANVVSVGGKIAVPHLLPYTVSKFALTGLTKGLRAELAKDNILVTGIYPSTMRTGGHAHAFFKGNRQAEYTWFALGDTVPLVSTSAEAVARRLWDAVRHGDPEVNVGWQSHARAVVDNLLPNLTTEMLSLVNRVMPGPGNRDVQPVQGEDLHGPIPDALNQAVPSAARPA